MDLIKTGDYIAEKRRGLGLTQAQLAEQLGMSDKSVSKWERGVCLPDTRVYVRLCEILGISVNEFIAGEDIPAEALPKKADENLVDVSTDGAVRRRRLWWVIGGLAAVLAIVLVAVLIPRNEPIVSSVWPVTPDSGQMGRAIKLVSGPEGSYLFNVITGDEFAEMVVHVDVWLQGKPAGEAQEFAFPVVSHTRTGLGGMLALVPYTDRALVHLAFADGANASYAMDIELPEGAALGPADAVSRGTMGEDFHFKLQAGERYPVLALIFDDDGQAYATLHPEDSDGLQDTDVYYLVSLEFR